MVRNLTSLTERLNKTLITAMSVVDLENKAANHEMAINLQYLDYRFLLGALTALLS